MINKIISHSVNHKVVVLCVIGLLLIVGGYSVTQLPIDAVPDITDNQVQIITSSPSLSAEDLERKVTIPIENAIANIKGLKSYRSFSRFGLSLITVIFEDQVDIYWARQQIAEKLNNVKGEIPQEFGTPELAPITTGLGEIFQYSIKPKKGYENQYSKLDLRTIQDWIVRKQFLSVKGVADVSSFGGHLKQFHILVNPTELVASGFSVSDIVHSIQANNANTGSAYLEFNSEALYIKTDGLIGTQQDLENIAIKSQATGRLTALKNIATITEGSATRYGAQILNGREEVAGGIVMMLKGENSNTVINRIKQKLPEVEKMLPEGIELKPFLDRTKLVNNSIKTVVKNLTEGAVIVLIVLIVFLGNLRSALIVASIIPLSMLIAIILMNIFGVSGNLMSLGAIDFGIIVDGAIIIVESVLLALYHEDNGLSKRNIDHLVIDKAHQLMRSALFGQIIIVIVYFPLFTLSGVEGKMFRPMVETIIFALIGALILSLTYIPVMCAIFLKNGNDRSFAFSDQIILWLESKYAQAVFFLTSKVKITFIATLVSIVISIILIKNMGGEFMPSIAEGDFAVETRLLTGSSLSASIEYSSKAAQILKDSFDEVEQVVTKIGSGEIPTDPMPMEAADMMVILKDKSQWKNANSFDELAEKMKAKIENVIGVLFSFQYPVQMRFNELLSGAKQDVVLKIYGHNLDSLSYYGQLIQNLAQKIEGIDDLYLETITGVSQLSIRYDRSKLLNYDLDIESVNMAVQAYNSGVWVTNIYENEIKTDVMLKVHHQDKQDISSLKNLPIPTRSGLTVPLSEVAHVEQVLGVNQIQRDMGKRRLILGFNAKNRDVESIVNELKSKIDQNIRLPQGYFTSFSGSYQNLIDAKIRLGLVVPIALLVILLLLRFAIGQWKLVVLLFSIIPLSSVGGVLFLAARGLPFSISAGVGFIALMGISVLNGIVLINEMLHRKLDLTDLQTSDLIAVCKNRLRPILITAVVASLGFLPMAINTSLGAEIQRPLATVVIGGLISSTIGTLFVLPLMIQYFMKRSFSFNFSKNLIWLGLLILPTCGYSQTSLTFRQSLDSLSISNQQLISAQSIAQLYSSLSHKFPLLQGSNLSAEYGQINTPYNDIKIDLVQNINNPWVANYQKKINQLQAQLTKISAKEQTLMMRKRLVDLVVEIRKLHKWSKELDTQDSILKFWLKIENYKHQRGESSKLEANIAALQALKNEQYRLETEQTLFENLMMYNLMLNSSSLYQPDLIEPIVSYYSGTISDPAQHPMAIIKSIEQSILNLELKKIKSEWLPDGFLGYSNVSLRGIVNYMGRDQYYDISDRFHSFKVGLTFNAFDATHRRNLSIQKSLSKINKYQYDIAIKQAQSEYNILTQKIQNYQLYLSNSNTPATIAESKRLTISRLKAGEISYNEFYLYQLQIQESIKSYLEIVAEYERAILSLYILNY